MSTLAEIEAAVEELAPAEKEALLAFLSARLKTRETALTSRPGALRVAGEAPLEGLPADLSIDTRQRIRESLNRQHAANR